MRLIDLDELMKFPIRSDHCDKEHANPYFIDGIETVFEYAEQLPTLCWIPTTERLPTVEDCDPAGYVLAVYNTNGSKWVAPTRLGDFKKYPELIPYWMSMPEPPKDGDGK